MTESHLSLEAKERLIQRELRVERLNGSSRDLPRDVREVLDYIHAHLFDESLSVQTIRKACRIRNHNISSRFRMLLGTSIRDYIEALRMEAASRLLGHPELEIYLVGAAVGYAHQESFCRAFRRRFGCSPLGFREQLQAGNSQEGMSRKSV